MKNKGERMMYDMKHRSLAERELGMFMVVALTPKPLEHLFTNI